MARALQCPDCGWREPLDNVSHLAEFRCHGCGRALKVPAELQAPAPPAAAEPGPETRDEPELQADATAISRATAVAEAPPEPTRVFARATLGEPPNPNGEAAVRGAPGLAAPDRPLPWLARFAVWAGMLPVGLVATFWFANKVSWLDRDDLIDTLGEVRWDRFVPILRLMPLAALVVAVLVHVTILVLERIARGRRARRSGRIPAVRSVTAAD
jgi:hypothetical protein